MVLSDADTIVAIATAPGTGAIGIVRVSGNRVPVIATTIAGGLPPPRLATLRRFADIEGQDIDEGLMLYFPAPRSFTGEDLLEFHCHGGPVVLTELLRAIAALGARQARPGEFTERAFLHGKIDLLQAEAVADLIGSASARAARCAFNSLRGRFSEHIRELSEAVIAVRVRTEASVDFPDEAIDPSAAETLAAAIDTLRARLAKVLATATCGATLNRGLDIAIIGPPNAGKSTLLNRLAQADAAIVSPYPGTTRDVVSVDIELAGLAVRLHDTAGIHVTDDAIEVEGIRRATDAVRRADLVVAVSGSGDCDAVLLSYIDENLGPGAARLIVHNKIDVVGARPRLETTASGTEIFLSALTGAGVDALRAALLDAATGTAVPDSEYLARQRHLDALRAAADELAGVDATSLLTEPEIVAERLRRAHRALGAIVGEFTTEDLLAEIFANFCLGK